MRTLGLDPGSERVGLALSDELGILASPAGYLAAEPHDELLQQIRNVCQEKAVTRVVVGLPRNMNGTYGPAAEKSRTFAAALRETLTVPVVTWDERLTTAQAHRALSEGQVKGRDRRQRIDAAAAAVLLQSYLDAHPAP